ncbi:hypothetical protein [Methanosarcina sp.]|jgi:bacterioferritin
MVKDKNPVTYNIVFQILTDEIEHEDNPQAVTEYITCFRANIDLV